MIEVVSKNAALLNEGWTIKTPHLEFDMEGTFSKMGLPVRKIGSAALTLAYVAAGRYDAFWSPSLSPWDYAAGKLLLEEAGGQMRQFSDEPISSLDETSIIASNKVLHSQMLKNIQSKIGNTSSS